MMKLRFKRISAVLLTALSIVILLCWTFLEPQKNLKRPLPAAASTERNPVKARLDSKPILDDEDFSDNVPVSAAGSSKRTFKNIDCLINDEYSVGCVKSSDNAVYVPFPFLRKYFEIGGSLLKRPDGSEYLNWQHSYSKVFFPREPYDYRGVFLWFDNYNVETRDRVKYISAISGVPISSQWKPEGHPYPIQIAQFGLSHFSKNLTLGRPRVFRLENGSFKQEHWNVLNLNEEGVRVESMTENSIEQIEGFENNVLLVEGRNVIFNVKKKKYNDLLLSITFKPLSNLTITLVALSLDMNKEFRVHYRTIDEEVVIASSSNVTYGLGSGKHWRTINRDVLIDLQKIQNMQGKKNAIKFRNLRLVRVIFSGKVLLDEVKLASSAHEAQFRTAAKWLVQNQDDKGGWPVKVTRKLQGGELILKPGWYSAMAQGQAISLLSRAYQVTKDSIYLDSAIKALNLFSINSTEKGIRTYFLNKYIWFEEYPTVPSCYVLNGFIYSLFGLYDLKMTCKREECAVAGQLFQEGLISLKALLPLFDSGTGSIYDLRHVSLGSAPNLARWDYHTTHINQLLYLNSITNDLIFQTTAKRWVSYMKGKRAPHN